MMEFTKGWTKGDNDELRKLIKDGKTPDEIINIIGYEKLRKHPYKKYVGQFNKFILNEIYFQPKKTIYNVIIEPSMYYNGYLNYISKFETDSGQKYIIDFVIVKENDGQFKDHNIFNLSFTIEENRDFTNYKKYEKETNKKEHIELTKKLIYVIQETIKIIKINYDNIIILIGETENKKKINFYRNIIKDSLDNIIEIKDKSSFTNGLSAYYYIEKN